MSRFLRCALVVIFSVLAQAGCRHAQDNAKVPASRPGRGPQFVVLIVDSSASVSTLRPSILEYAKLALDTYARNGPVKVTVINLNDKPTVEFQKEGDLFDEDVADVVKHVKQINYSATGTNIIGAFEEMMKYYSYEREKPAAFKVLCFTDGLIEAPSGQKYKDWSEFDWAKLEQVGASIGFYFIDPSVRDKVEAAVMPIKKSFVKNKNDALDDLKQEEAQIP